jgi:hypothetical protein
VESPTLTTDFQKILHQHTAGSPVQEEIRWTDLTTKTITEKLNEHGHGVSVHMVDQLLDRHDFRRRQAQKQLPLQPHPSREEQFERIAYWEARFRNAGHPVLSIDTKKRELIGHFFRPGGLWTRRPIHTFDQDFPSFSNGVVIPHGIDDEKQNRGYLHLGTRHDTSAFACAGLRDWWIRYGQYQYANAKSV